jgi:uridine kinase
MSPQRAAVLGAVAEAVLEGREAHAERPLLVAVDGVDGSGKTVFAAELEQRIRGYGLPVEVVHVDDFLHLRAQRYRLGRDSPEGFFLDSYDHEALNRLLLDPLGAGGSGRYRTASSDVRTNELVEAPERVARPGLVVLVEGLFLHRDELVARWDRSVFLDVPFAVSVARMARRDGSPDDPRHPRLRRYVEGQQRYFAACAPWERATIVIDNSDVDQPRIRP